MKKIITFLILAALISSVQISHAQSSELLLRTKGFALDLRNAVPAPRPYVVQQPVAPVVVPVTRIDLRNATTLMLPPGANTVVMDGVIIPAGATVQLANRSVISVVATVADQNNPSLWVPIACTTPVEIVFTSSGYERREYCSVGGTMAYFKVGECRKGGTFVKIAYN